MSNPFGTFKDRHPDIFETLHPETQKKILKFPTLPLMYMGQDGIIQVSGLSPCPYCNKECPKVGPFKVTTCPNGHKVKWLPWGG